MHPQGNQDLPLRYLDSYSPLLIPEQSVLVLLLVVHNHHHQYHLSAATSFSSRTPAFTPLLGPPPLLALSQVTRDEPIQPQVPPVFFGFLSASFRSQDTLTSIFPPSQPQVLLAELAPWPQVPPIPAIVWHIPLASTSAIPRSLAIKLQAALRFDPLDSIAQPSSFSFSSSFLVSILDWHRPLPYSLRISCWGHSKATPPLPTLEVA